MQINVVVLGESRYLQAEEVLGSHSLFLSLNPPQPWLSTHERTGAPDNCMSDCHPQMCPELILARHYITLM